MVNEDVKIIELSFVNAFLLKVADGFILIDTGLPMLWGKLESELKASGCVPGNLKLVIITHGDPDHIGNCAKLQKQYTCKIAMHKDDVRMAEEGVSPKRKVRTLRAKIRVLKRKLKGTHIEIEKFKPDLFLHEGQNLNEYGLNASVIHIPGHTKGSIGILTSERDLFAGDIMINYQKPDKAVYIESLRDLKNSYSRLKSMGLKTIYTGHGKAFEFSEIIHKL